MVIPFGRATARARCCLTPAQQEVDDPGKLELFRKVLLASASFPGLLPPVAIDMEVDGQRYTELHVDGGVSASLSLQPAMVGLHPAREFEETGADRNVCVIVAGKLRPPARPVERRLFRIASESLEGVVQAQFEGDLLKTYLLARFAGARFALTAAPDEFREESESMSFDPHVIHDLFDLGYRSAAAGAGWRSLPPSLSPGNYLPPRGGVHFTVEEARPDTLETTSPARSGANPAGRGAILRILFQRVLADVKRATTPGCLPSASAVPRRLPDNQPVHLPAQSPLTPELSKRNGHGERGTPASIPTARARPCFAGAVAISRRSNGRPSGA